MKFWISAIGGVLEAGRIAVVVADDPRHQRARLDAHGLVGDPAFVGVVTDLHVADQGEVLAERMADEAVVGQDAPQIRMPFEEYAVEIDLTSGGLSVPVKTRSRIRALCCSDNK